jgi:hypothetical protein
MKEYIKPIIEFVELRPEEGLAANGSNCAGGVGASSPSHFHD